MIVFPLLIRGERSRHDGVLLAAAARVPRRRRPGGRGAGESRRSGAHHRGAVRGAAAGARGGRPRAAAGRISRRSRDRAQRVARLRSDADGRRELAVPTIADWCAVDIVGERARCSGWPSRTSIPTKVEFARTLQERYPADPQRAGGVHEVIRTGKPMLMSAHSAGAPRSGGARRRAPAHPPGAAA